MAHFDQGRRNRRERKSEFSSSSRAYNESLQALDTDEAKAFRLNYMAALEGMHDAVLAMGWFYLNGVGVKTDEQAAVRWYKKAARHGDPMAMYSLGEIAYRSRDYVEALTWFRRAADKGHQRSKFCIGKMYWRGHGIARDQKLARDCFAEAAEGGIEAATRILRYVAFQSRKDADSLGEKPVAHRKY